MLNNSSCATRFAGVKETPRFAFNLCVWCQKFSIPQSSLTCHRVKTKKIISCLKQSFEVEMEATTIDQLFPDVLEEIFSHLSGNDLKNCALVCKDWEDVIGSYATTMKKLKIGVCLDRDDISIGLWPNRTGIKIQSSDESQRKYRNVEILIRDGSLTQLPSLDRFNLSQVKSLNLCFAPSGSIEFNKVMELLSRMPLLQVLTIVFSSKCTLDTSNALVAHFPKLKRLNIFYCYCDQPINKVYDFIKADNITETELTYHALNYVLRSDAEVAAMADFMKSKKSLSKLTVSTDLFAQLHRRHDFSGMSLESLIVNGGSGNTSDILIENFLKSLIANAHSLTSLSIPSWLMSKEVLVAIFSRLGKLTTLEIITRGDDDGSWMDDLSPNGISHNLSLKTLKVNRVGAMDGFKTILQRAPQLKNLMLGSVSDAIMNEVATSAPRLVELTIGDLEENLTGEQRFNELKSLRIHRIVNVDSFTSLLERCPKIATFKYDFYYYPPVDTNRLNNIVDILLQQKSLKHLRFLYCEPAARIIFDKLKANYGNLRSLKIRSSDGKFILFDFPENPAEWNVEAAEARLSDFEWRIRHRV